MPGFLDRLQDVFGGAADKAVDLTSRIRYGVSPEDKQRMTLERGLPGAPSYLEDPAAAERYSSTYLGARKWGRIPAEFLNALAFSDIGQGAAGERRKATGALGAQAGDIERQVRERKRMADIQRLFGRMR